MNIELIETFIAIHAFLNRSDLGYGYCFLYAAHKL